MTTLPAGSTNATIPRPPADAYNWHPPSEVQQQLVQAGGADGNGKPADPYRYNPPSEESDDKVTDSAVPQPPQDKDEEGKGPESPAVIVVPVVVTPNAPKKSARSEGKDDEDDEDDDMDSDYVPSEEEGGDDDDDDDETDMEGSDSDPEETLKDKLAELVPDNSDDEE